MILNVLDLLKNISKPDRGEPSPKSDFKGLLHFSGS